MGLVEDYCRKHFRRHCYKSKLVNDISEESYSFPKLSAPDCESALGKFLVGRTMLKIGTRADLLEALNKFKNLGLKTDSRDAIFRIGYKQCGCGFLIFSKTPYSMTNAPVTVDGSEFLADLPRQLKVRACSATPTKAYSKHFNVFLGEFDSLYLGMFTEVELADTTWDLVFPQSSVVKLDLPESEMSPTNLEGFVGFVYDTVIPVENPLSFTLRNEESLADLFVYAHEKALLEALKKAASQCNNSVVAIYKITMDGSSPRLVHACSLGDYSREVFTTASR